MTTTTSSTLLKAYCRMWVAQHLLMCGALSYVQQQMTDENESTAPPTSMLLAPLLVLLAMFPSAWLLCVAHVAAWCVTAAKLPMVWDFQVWDLQTDFTFVGAILLSRGTVHALDVAGPVIRLQYIVFYAFTALWKLNSTFFDRERSCAPIFFLQLLEMLVPESVTPSWLPGLAAASAPAVTVLVEAAIPALLCLPRLRRAGVALGLLLHALIALTPPPNNAGAFSCCLLVRYVFLHPAAVARAAADARTLAAAAGLAAVGFARWPSDLAVS